MKNCNVREFGAAGDGVTKDTLAVQAAIDASSAAGGGRVTLEGGKFLCGRIDLKSGVEFHLERDAVLLFSTDVNDFPEIETSFWNTDYAPRFNRRCMLYAEDCEDIALSGRGVIDCQGMAYVLPMTEEMIAERPHQSYFRKPFPSAAANEMDPKELYRQLMIRTDPRLTSLAPARVALFMGCRNVSVEGVTMTNQPAGWSYWVCGCGRVSFPRAPIRAAVDLPNNVGTHINSCRNVTVSDCNITTGDDSIVVRAYSAPLGKDTPCENVVVTNCNLTSHAFAVRISWIGDGVMRNMAFSNLTITDSTTGIGMFLKANPSGKRLSDEGFEDTLIENISFSNIVIDRNLKRPVKIEINEKSRCAAIRDVHFSHVYARSAWMPEISGKADCPVENVTFSDCRFTQMTYEEMKTFFGDRMIRYDNRLEPTVFRHVKGLTLDGTSFDAL